MNEKDKGQPQRPGRGFAGMDREKQKAISSKGGKAAHSKGTAHEFTAEEARNAGRKGGQAVSQDRAHMAAIGREGGKSRGSARRQEKAMKEKATEGNQPRESGEQSDVEPGPASTTQTSTFQASAITPPRASGQN